jgi:uncharacterized protein (DUF1778 family)
MSTRDEHDKTRLAIEIEPELRKRIETAAALQGVSMRDYVVAALREALDSNESERPSSLSQLSTRSFARDWESDVDVIYDDLA